jgi:DNA-binding response OmpR family regulator
MRLAPGFREASRPDGLTRCSTSRQNERAMYRILLADDDSRTGSSLADGLRSAGYRPVIVASEDDALELADSDDFDLLLIGIGRMAAADGMARLRQLRARGRQIPVIILAASDRVEDAVAALEAGADDYIGKPFGFEELLARVAACLRARSVQKPAVLRVGRAELDLINRRLVVGDEEIELTRHEFALASVFFRYPDQTLSREQLLHHAWGAGYVSESNVVEVYVRHLRRKLGDDLITTVRGEGYRLESDPDSSRAPDETEGGDPEPTQI